MTTTHDTPAELTTSASHDDETGTVTVVREGPSIGVTTQIFPSGATASSFHYTDGGQAVVEDGMAAGTPSERGRAFSGHGARQGLQESIDAAAVLESFTLVDEDGSFVPMIDTSIEELAEQLAGESGRTVEDEAFLLARAFIDRRISRRGFLGGVSLDLNPSRPGFPQDLGHPSMPAVLFYEVSPGSMLSECGICPVCTGQVTDEPRCRNAISAIAIWFQPEVDDLGYAVSPRTARNGREYSDDTFVAGYYGIVERYPTLRAADEDMRSLRRAVRTLATPDTADEPDTMRDELNNAAELEDRTAARLRRSSMRRTRASF